jgi:hypothetical protein
MATGVLDVKTATKVLDAKRERERREAEAEEIAAREERQRTAEAFKASQRRIQGERVAEITAGVEALEKCQEILGSATDHGLAGYRAVLLSKVGEALRSARGYLGHAQEKLDRI